MTQKRQRSRRVLTPEPKSSPIAQLVNVMLLIVALSIILLSQCDSTSTKTQDGSWIDHFITPKDLHLPKSVLDLEAETNMSSPSQVNSSDLGTP